MNKLEISAHHLLNNSDRVLRTLLIFIISALCAPLVAWSTFHSVLAAVSSCGAASTFDVVHSYVIASVMALLSMVGTFLLVWLTVGLTIPLQHAIENIHEMVVAVGRVRRERITSSTPSRGPGGTLFRLMSDRHGLVLSNTGKPVVSRFRLFLFRNTRVLATIALFAFPAVSAFCLAQACTIMNKCLVTDGAKLASAITAIVIALAVLGVIAYLDSVFLFREKAIVHMAASVLSRVLRTNYLNLYKRLVAASYRKDGSTHPEVFNVMSSQLCFGRNASEFTYSDLIAAKSFYEVERQRMRTNGKCLLNFEWLYEFLPKSKFSCVAAKSILGEGSSVSMERFDADDGLNLFQMTVPETETLKFLAASIRITPKNGQLRVSMTINSATAKGSLDSYEGILWSKTTSVQDILVYCAQLFVAVRPTLPGVEKTKFDGNGDVVS